MVKKLTLSAVEYSGPKRAESDTFERVMVRPCGKVVAIAAGIENATLPPRSSYI